MRLIIGFALAALLVPSTAANAQDAGFTQILQRLCLPFIEAPRASRWQTVDAATRALSMSLTSESETEDGPGRGSVFKMYSYVQSGRSYRVELVAYAAGTLQCEILALGGITTLQARQAVTAVVGDGWEASFTSDGDLMKYVWSRSEASGRETRITALRTMGGAPLVNVTNANAEYWR